MAKEKKIFVLDTNVILHDYKCIYNFEENDIVVPIVVLEELDKLKRGNDILNMHAREFTRELDALSGEGLCTSGIPLGKKLGKLFIITGKPFSKNLQASFPESTPDHRILAIAEYIQESNKGQYSTTVLVTKDINLRVKAKSLGILAQDYKSDKVHDLETFFHSIETIEKVDPKHISELYNLQDGIPLSNVTKKKVTDESAKYFIIRNEKTSVLARYNRRTSNLEKVEKLRCYGIEPRNAEQTFSLNALMDPEIQLVALTGKAGTGKTLLALAAALQQEKDFETIYLARPIVPLANRDLGFLPGDVNEKIGPYMQPLYDNLSFIKHKLKVQSKEAAKIDEMQKNEKLQITPLAYIRGRSLSNAFFIVDEAQNLTPHEVKTIITRAGEGTKMVFTGDIQQIDSPYLDSFSNGLSYLTNKMQGQEIFAHIHLLKGERSYLADLAGNLL